MIKYFLVIEFIYQYSLFIGSLKHFVTVRANILFIFHFFNQDVCRGISYSKSTHLYSAYYTNQIQNFQLTNIYGNM